jgi:microcystin-dependent protein
VAEPFLSEIRIFSFNFPPKGWAFCNGQVMPINQNQALFALLGTTYGGNGQTTFALPDLRDRVPISFGGGFTLGTVGGSPSVTLTQQTMPEHIHTLQASTTDADSPDPFGLPGPAGHVLAEATFNVYGAAAALTTMKQGTVGNVGGSQAHSNEQPYLTLNFCIALQGIFPSRN